MENPFVIFFSKEFIVCFVVFASRGHGMNMWKEFILQPQSVLEPKILLLEGITDILLFE